MNTIYRIAVLPTLFLRRNNPPLVALLTVLLVSFGFLPGGTLTAYAQTEPAQTELTPKCETPTVKGDPDCWLKVENHDNCYLWISPGNEQTVTWSGQCRAGKPHGRGKLIWKFEGKETASNIGSYMDGKVHGRWNFRFSNGTRRTSSYVDGKLHGKWEEREPNGNWETGTYVDGKKHGRWEERWDDHMFVTHFVDGKKHGMSRLEHDASISTWPYVNGKMHGISKIIIKDDGSKLCTEYEHGVMIRSNFKC